MYVYIWTAITSMTRHKSNKGHYRYTSESKIWNYPRSKWQHKIAKFLAGLASFSIHEQKMEAACWVTLSCRVLVPLSVVIGPHFLLQIG